MKKAPARVLRPRRFSESICRLQAAEMSPRTLPLPPEHRFHFPRPRRILRRVFRKSVLQALVLFLCSYFLIYIFLSAGGMLRVVRDKVEWCPYGLRFDAHRNAKQELVFRGSFFGYVFAPLILVDRMVVHASVPLDSPEGRAFEQRERETIEQEWHRDGNR
jgi:hypothetical protein